MAGNSIPSCYCFLFLLPFPARFLSCTALCSAMSVGGLSVLLSNVLSIYVAARHPDVIGAAFTDRDKAGLARLATARDPPETLLLESQLSH